MKPQPPWVWDGTTLQAVCRTTRSHMYRSQAAGPSQWVPIWSFSTSGGGVFQNILETFSEEEVTEPVKWWKRDFEQNLAQHCVLSFSWWMIWEESTYLWIFLSILGSLWDVFSFFPRFSCTAVTSTFYAPFSNLDILIITLKTTFLPLKLGMFSLSLIFLLHTVIV